LWTEKSGKYPPVLFDYFFLTEGTYNEFLDLDHIYPEEFPNILEVSDHIPIVLKLGRNSGVSLNKSVSETKNDKGASSLVLGE